MAQLQRTPTFVVGQGQQRQVLDIFQRREQHFDEEYRRSKPLCFQAKAYQKTHPAKAKQGRTDADVTLVSPMMVGVADGVSQIEDFGINPALLPQELLARCKELAVEQLIPAAQRTKGMNSAPYLGPIPLMRRAFEETKALGSTTVLFCALDNSTQIHGKLHPMIAVLSIGDCEVLILRRCEGAQSPLKAVFHTEMQRMDGHAQAPLQIARVDDRVDPNFEEYLTIDIIERGSAVHCLSAYEGDIVILGSDGVFDNLFLDEIVSICNEYLAPPPRGAAFQPEHPSVLDQIARRVVQESHMKTDKLPNGEFNSSPIGRGGKVDDTCCVCGQVVEWTDQHNEMWRREQSLKQASYVGTVFSGSFFSGMFSGMLCGQEKDGSQYGSNHSSEEESEGSEADNSNGYCSLGGSGRKLQQRR